MLANFKISESIYTSYRTKVFRGEEISSHKKVILKLREYWETEKYINDLQNEFEIGKIVKNEYTLNYLEFSRNNDKGYIVAEDNFMVPLSSITPEKGFSTSEFLKYAIQISKAVETLHSKNIIHKDINPANFIVDPSSNRVKILDLETAAYVSQEYIEFEPSNLIEGTLSYISPEQTGRINKPLDYRSDLYSLGVLFYELLTNKRPFESEKPEELIYQHIAKTAPPVSAIRSDIPYSLSQVVDKLLYKSPNSRYQSISGLINDMVFLQNELSENKPILNFNPGQNEKTNKLIITQRLYGRDNEIAILLDHFRKSRENAHIVSVTGEAGIGKTSLIRELYTPITESEGFFISGKFDQLRRDNAYSALTQALSDLVQQILTKDTDPFKQWKQLMQSSVGEFGQVLLNIVPEFEAIIGQQPELAQLSPMETLSRRNWVFARLFKSICSLNKPVVMFIDDLQWADATTISLFEHILDQKLDNFLLILSYREKEVPGIHPLRSLLEKLKTSALSYKEIHLENLTTEAVEQWLQDIFQKSGEKIDDIAEQIYAKSGGNPFYIWSLLQLIINKQYIFQNSRGEWVFNLDAIDNIPSNVNVVDHLVEKIHSLSPEDFTLLTELSILGIRFPIYISNLFLNKGWEEYSNNIYSLTKLNLLSKNKNMLTFSHDRLLQAVDSILKEEKKMQLHLKAARNLQAFKNENPESDLTIDQFIHHYNQAIPLITDQNKRRELAELNFSLGKQLKQNAAYSEAEKIFSFSIQYLSDSPFDDFYELAIELFTEYGEVLYLNHRYEEGEKQFQKVLNHARSPLHNANVFIKQIVHYASNHQLAKSMEIAIHALSSLGVKLPSRFLKVSVLNDLIKLQLSMRHKTPETILNEPAAENPLVLAQMKVLAAAAVPAYIGFPDYYPSIILRMVQISNRNGICAMSAFAYANYGVILSSLGKEDKGFTYGNISLRLNEKYQSKSLKSKIPYIFGMFIHHWKQPVKASFPYFEQAISNGFESGDYEFASYAANNLMHVLFYSGHSIPELLNKYPQQHKLLASFNKAHAKYEAKYWHQFLKTVYNPDGDGYSVNGEIFNENEVIPRLEKRKDLSSLAIYYHSKMLLAYLKTDYKLAVSNRSRTMELQKATTGTLFVVESHFINALSCIACYKYHNKEKSFIRSAKNSYRKLKKWGKSSPANYLSKSLLVGAELLSLSGSELKGQKQYEASIKAAIENQNKLDLGLAYECFGRFLISNNHEEYGLYQINRSYQVFYDWGALYKARLLSEEFHIPHDSNVISNKYSFKNASTMLNLEALIETIHALSGNFNFETLMEILLNSIMLNSGATRVIYVSIEDEIFKVKAEKNSDRKANIFVQDGAQIDDFNLPINLLYDCAQKPGNVLLKNMDNENPDQSVYKTVLILPVQRHDVVTAIIYLENNLMADAFREDQIQYISLIAGQAAINIENALIFEKLKAEKNYSANIITNSPLLICGLGVDGTTNFINPEIEKITGYEKQELLGKNWWEIFYPEQEYEQVNTLYQEFSKGDVTDYKMYLTCKDGSKRTVLWSSYTQRDKSGKIEEILGFGNDITRQDIAEQASKRNRELYRLLFERSQSAIFVVDMKTGKYLDANVAAENLTGRSIEEITGLTIHDITPSDSNQRLKKGRVIAKGKKSKDLGEVTYLRPDGSIRIALLSVLPIDEHTVIGMANDITELKRSQEVMLQTEKMMSVGGLAAGMAHEINNPLAGILQNLQVIQNRLNTTLPQNIKIAAEQGIKLENMMAYFRERSIDKMFDGIYESGKRAARIIENMLRFSRKSESKFAPRDICHLFDETIELAKNDYDLKKKYDFRQIEIIREYQQPIREVYCEGSEIQQVFLNILKNGAQAMAEKGEQIKTGKDAVYKPEFRIRISEENNMANIEIEDNGPGMPEEVRKRIFEPFYTTKKEGVGTGLGLSVSYFIITENHKGSIEVDSQEGKGTMFIIKLPFHLNNS